MNEMSNIPKLIHLIKFKIRVSSILSEQSLIYLQYVWYDHAGSLWEWI